MPLELRPGYVIVMDNLSSHMGARAREKIESVGARLEYSPDFNPIENTFSKLKAPLRPAAECSIGRLWTTTGRLLNFFTQTSARTISLPLDTIQYDRSPLQILVSSLFQREACANDPASCLRQASRQWRGAHCRHSDVLPSQLIDIGLSAP